MSRKWSEFAAGGAFAGTEEIVGLDGSTNKRWAVSNFVTYLMGSSALTSALAAKAPLASPGLTGVPTAPTATLGANTTQISTTAFVQAAIAALVNSSPSTLDTLKELADALGDDPNFAATIATALGLKAPSASPTFTGTPAAPTAAPGTNTTQLATTAFVVALAAAGYQAIDPTITALAAFNSNGLLTQTAADTFAARTLTVGSAKIVVTNGSGVAGNPTVDLGSVASTDLSDSGSLYRSGGTDVAVADGGTGASTQAGAQTNLGLVIGTDVAAVTNTQTFIASGTYTKPTGAKSVRVIAMGGSGGGGGGGKAATLTLVSGGGAGGGGGYDEKVFAASALGSTETVTIGAGGAGGAGATVNGAGVNGTGGGTTTFGSWVSVKGGGAGAGGNAATGAGGGGGGSPRAAGTDASGATAGNSNSAITGFPGGSGASATPSGNPYSSGGGGGGGSLTTGTGGGAGGAAAGGGGGGGGGGGLTAANAESAGGAASGFRASAAAAGTSGGGAGGTGTTPATGDYGPGVGGGGGGSSDAGTGGAGGVGGRASGGGGGGASHGGNGGAGGTGGDGYMVVITFF